MGHGGTRGLCFVQATRSDVKYFGPWVGRGGILHAGDDREARCRAKKIEGRTSYLKFICRTAEPEHEHARNEIGASSVLAKSIAAGRMNGEMQ